MNMSEFIDKYGTDTASMVIFDFAERFLAHQPVMQQELMLIAGNLKSALRSLTGSQRDPH